MFTYHQNQGSDELSGGNCGTTTPDYQGYYWLGHDRHDALPGHARRWFGSVHIFWTYRFHASCGDTHVYLLSN